MPTSSNSKKCRTKPDTTRPPPPTTHHCRGHAQRRRERWVVCKPQVPPEPHYNPLGARRRRAGRPTGGLHLWALLGSAVQLPAVCIVPGRRRRLGSEGARCSGARTPAGHLHCETCVGWLQACDTVAMSETRRGRRCHGSVGPSRPPSSGAWGSSSARTHGSAACHAHIPPPISLQSSVAAAAPDRDSCSPSLHSQAKQQALTDTFAAQHGAQRQLRTAIGPLRAGQHPSCRPPPPTARHCLAAAPCLPALPRRHHSQ